MIQILWRDAFAQCGYVGQRHHVAAAKRYVDVGNVLWRVAILRGHLHDDIVLFAAFLETRHHAPAQHGFHCSTDGIDGHAEIRELLAVDRDACSGLI